MRNEVLRLQLQWWLHLSEKNSSMAFLAWLLSSCFSRCCKHSSKMDSSRPLRIKRGIDKDQIHEDQIGTSRNNFNNHNSSEARTDLFAITTPVIFYQLKTAFLPRDRTKTTDEQLFINTNKSTKLEQRDTWCCKASPSQKPKIIQTLQTPHTQIPIKTCSFCTLSLFYTFSLFQSLTPPHSLLLSPPLQNSGNVNKISHIYNIQVQKLSTDKNKLIFILPEPTLLQPIFAPSLVTCLGQSDGPIYYSSPWSASHKHVPGTHRTQLGPKSFPGSCCWFLPHSLCWSPGGGAAGNGSPGVGSDHLTSLKRKGHKLILHRRYHRSSPLETRTHIQWGTTLAGSQWWNSFWKVGYKHWPSYFPPQKNSHPLENSTCHFCIYRVTISA